MINRKVNQKIAVLGDLLAQEPQGPFLVSDPDPSAALCSCLPQPWGTQAESPVQQEASKAATI